MEQPEHILQVECIKWFRLQYPQYYWNLFAIPNGGKRNIGTAKKLKAEGVVSGVADLFLAIPCEIFHGLFIEMKIKPSGASANQKKFGIEMAKEGYQWVLIYTFDEFRNYVNNWMKTAKK